MLNANLKGSTVKPKTLHTSATRQLITHFTEPWTVSQFTQELKEHLEAYNDVMIQGEIAPNTCKMASSGHCYFNLTDAKALLKCVWFQGSRQKAKSIDHNPHTGEVIEPYQHADLEDLQQGGKFICAGKISLYEPRGEYQLVVSYILQAGVGNLAAEFERLKKELASWGYFAKERKRPIPKNPRRVALITAPGGAAICDFCRLAASRGLSAKIRLFPSLVQGAEAVPQLTQAIAMANAQNWAEVLVIIRGGGSLEDLWCFNDKAVAKAIYESRIPVLAGIGHEIDFTLADLTADLRAATPTEAAVLLWSVRTDLAAQVHTLHMQLTRSMQSHIARAEHNLAHLEKVLRLASPARRLQMMQERLQNLVQQFHLQIRNWLTHKGAHLQQLEHQLAQTVTAETLKNKVMQINVAQDKLRRNVKVLLQNKLQVLAQGVMFLGQRMTKKLETETNSLEKLLALLESKKPTALLKRGYAIIEGAEGKIITSVQQASQGEDLKIHLADGQIAAKVQDIMHTQEHAQSKAIDEKK